MVSLLSKSLATALLCGAIGFAGTALAQGGAPAGSAGANATPPASTGTNATAPGSARTNASGAMHTGPGQIGSSAGSSASASKPDFLNNMPTTSTPAHGLSKAAKARVDAHERQITAQLNRASAQHASGANATAQASIGRSNQAVR